MWGFSLINDILAPAYFDSSIDNFINNFNMNYRVKQTFYHPCTTLSANN